MPPLQAGTLAGTFYRHYKGGLYEMVGAATLESDQSAMIVYRAADGALWIRPRDVFFEQVEIDGRLVPRFAPAADGDH